LIDALEVILSIIIGIRVQKLLTGNIKKLYVTEQ